MMKKPKDKRTKEYKEWKAKFDVEQAKKPDGLGDVVKSITTATGIDKLVKFVAGEDCGCDERQKKLNDMFNFNKVKCFNEEEFEWLTDFLRVKRGSVNLEQRIKLYDIYNRVFGTKMQNSNCPSCLLTIIRKLDAIFKTYK